MYWLQYCIWCPDWIVTLKTNFLMGVWFLTSMISCEVIYCKIRTNCRSAHTIHWHRYTDALVSYVWASVQKQRYHAPPPAVRVPRSTTVSLLALCLPSQTEGTSPSPHHQETYQLDSLTFLYCMSNCEILLSTNKYFVITMKL